eukprot:g10840.t1
MPEITRGAAQVFPEESWRRPLQRLQALLLSCLLPILLALLVVFAAFRLVKLFFQLLNDVYIVVRYVVLLAIRIALFPFYLLWLLLPSFIQDFLWENYEQRFGHRVRAVLSVKHAVEETISDVPDMLWACLVALYYSCVQPIGQTCRQLAWRLCGRMLVNTVFDPLHDAQVNKASWSKRKFIDGRGNKKRPVASQAVMASAHLRRAKVTGTDQTIGGRKALIPFFCGSSRGFKGGRTCSDPEHEMGEGRPNTVTTARERSAPQVRSEL